MTIGLHHARNGAEIAATLAALRVGDGFGTDLGKLDQAVQVCGGGEFFPPGKCRAGDKGA